MSRRIVNMTDGIKSQLLNKLRGSYFAMQIDEHTDITNIAQLLIYDRYTYKSEIKENFFIWSTTQFAMIFLFL